MSSPEPSGFNPAQAIRIPPSGGRRPLRKRLIAVLSAIVAAVLGAAPHVLHHAGPLAGAALLGGASGSVLFGVLGFAATIPLLMRLRPRTGSWRLPGLLLALFVATFLASTLIVGPALGSGDESSGGSGDERPETHHR